MGFWRVITIDITINGDVHVYGAEETIKKSVHKIRTSRAVKTAKSSVKSRDGCCQCCGEMDKPLEIHHILPVAKYPNLASDDGNMIALCQACHRKYHDKYDDEYVNAVTFAKYLKDYGTRIYGGR